MRWTRMALIAVAVGCTGSLVASIAELRAEIDDAIAVGDGACASVDDCASVGIGAKACGGPAEYVVYCATAVDEPALLDLVAEHVALSEEENARTNAVSDCSLVGPPAIALVDGTCTAQ